MGNGSLVLKKHWVPRRDVAIKGWCSACQLVEYWLLRRRRRVDVMDRSNSRVRGSEREGEETRDKKERGVRT